MASTLGAGAQRGLRIALVFDALFPVTKGGAERWFTALATELAAQGHDVTYVTSSRGAAPDNLPFAVAEVAHGGALYTSDGSRRLASSVRFGAATGWWLLRNRRHFDAFYVHQTPLFSVIAARLALGGRRPWAVEWIEWWTRDYWRRYAPGLVGRAGYVVQHLALRATPRATVFARSTERRLREARPALSATFLPGQVIDRTEYPSRPEGSSDVPLVLFVGRLVPEKHPDAVIETIAELSRTRPVRARIIGQGPLLTELRRRAASSGADIEVLGAVDEQALDVSYAEAAVLLHPSEREGFGLVVVEAASRGVPIVVVDGPDNAAVELVIPGVNGQVSPTRETAELARAVSAVLDGGTPLRTSTHAWFRDALKARSVQQTAVQLINVLGRDPQRGRAR